MERCRESSSPDTSARHAVKTGPTALFASLALLLAARGGGGENATPPSTPAPPTATARTIATAVSEATGANSSYGSSIGDQAIPASVHTLMGV